MPTYWHFPIAHTSSASLAGDGVARSSKIALQSGKSSSLFILTLKETSYRYPAMWDRKLRRITNLKGCGSRRRVGVSYLQQDRGQINRFMVRSRRPPGKVVRSLAH